jgi:hypothetical protein
MRPYNPGSPGTTAWTPPAKVFDGFDVSLRKVVQAPLVGQRTGQSADHRIVQTLRKLVWHIHHYPKGLDV